MNEVLRLDSVVHAVNYSTWEGKQILEGCKTRPAWATEQEMAFIIPGQTPGFN